MTVEAKNIAEVRDTLSAEQPEKFEDPNSVQNCVLNVLEEIEELIDQDIIDSVDWNLEDVETENKEELTQEVRGMAAGFICYKLGLLPDSQSEIDSYVTGYRQMAAIATYIHEGGDMMYGLMMNRVANAAQTDEVGAVIGMMDSVGEEFIKELVEDDDDPNAKFAKLMDRIMSM